MPYNGASAHRALGLAVAVSILLHALLLGFDWPLFTDALKRPVEALTPLVARLVEPPAPAPVVPEEKPMVASKPKPRPAPRPQPKPLPPVAPEPRAIVEAPPPAPAPAPTPLPAAPVAKAAPAPQAVPAPVAPAPADNVDTLKARFRAALIAAAKRHKGPYPPMARDNAWEGHANVRVAVARNGALALRVERSSGHTVLDRDAVEIVRRASAEVRVPEALRGQPFSVDVPVRYDLTDQASG